MHWLKLYVVGLIAISCCTSSKQLDINIQVGKSYYSSTEDIIIELKYTNTSRHAVSIPEKLIPTDSFWNNVFILTVNGQRAKYIGRLYKWLDRGVFIKLAPGQSISDKIDLSKLYDLRVGGNYSIQAVIPIHADFYSSNVVYTFIEGRVNFTTSQPISTRGMRTYKCSSKEIQALKTAFPIAVSWANQAYRFISTTDDISKSKQYKTWFGKIKKPKDNKKRITDKKPDPAQAIFKEVTENWRVVDQAISTKTVKFYCGCTNAIAFVFPQRAYEIYVCNEFFTWPIRGTNSQAGVIVHEMSHFYATANTDDYVYGEKDCQNLAKKRPIVAARNADNYMYFCSSTYR